MTLRIEPTDIERNRGLLRPLRQGFYHAPCGTAHMWSTEEALSHAKRATIRTHQFCKNCKKEMPVEQFVFQVRDEQGRFYRELMSRWEQSIK